jgi:bifunctional polynucleotide phosphatase/kinase
VHLAPSASERVAAFDLDSTLIKFARGGSKGDKKRATKVTTNGLEWEWWKAVVPQKLKEVHDSGCVSILSSRARSSHVLSLVLDPPYRCSIVVISNQNLKSAALTDWKKKIPQIAAAVRVSHRVLPYLF